jgi:Predicted membrane-bound metal-dependent hydrolase (DUF457).
MIFFGHLGLTTGAVKVYESLFDEKKENNRKLPIDYRIVLVGAILPDIIDKPIGAFLFRSTFHNSRIFAHTLIFSLILLILGAVQCYKNNKNRILTLGISSLIHLILDSMWLYPSILFWPIYGFKFPERPEGDWVKSDLIRLISDPTYFLPELIGFAIIAYYFIKLVKERKLKNFIKSGMM